MRFAQTIVLVTCTTALVSVEPSVAQTPDSLLILLDAADWRIKSFAVGHLRQLSDIDRPPNYADKVVTLLDAAVNQPDDNALAAGEGYGEYLTELARAALELNDVRTLRAMSILGIEFGTIFQEFVAARGAVSLQYLDEAWTDDGKRDVVAETWALMLGQFANLLSVQERRDLLGRLPALFEHDANDLAFLALTAGLPELVPPLIRAAGDSTVHSIRRALVANKANELDIARQALGPAELHDRILEWTEVFCQGQQEPARQATCDAIQGLLLGNVSDGAVLDTMAQHADEGEVQGLLTSFEATLIAGNARFLITSQGLSVERTSAPSGDTYLRQGAPNQNEGDALFLRLRANGNNRGLVHVTDADLAAAVGGGTVVNASLELTITRNADNWTTTGRTVDIHRVTVAWTEEGATWRCAVDTIPTNASTDCDTTAWEMGMPKQPEVHPFAATPTSTIVIANGQSGVVTFDVTADVQAFVAGSASNSGWVIKKTLEGQSGLVEFGSRESAAPPRLVVEVIPNQ